MKLHATIDWFHDPGKYLQIPPGEAGQALLVTPVGDVIYEWPQMISLPCERRRLVIRWSTLIFRLEADAPLARRLESSVEKIGSKWSISFPENKNSVILSTWKIIDYIL